MNITIYAPSDFWIYNYKDELVCYYSEKEKICETRLKDHSLIHILSGSLTISHPGEEKVFGKGDTVFLKRNHLLHKIKKPLDGEPFKAISLNFKTVFLRNIYKDIITALPRNEVENPDKLLFYSSFPYDPFLTGLFASLHHYVTGGSQPSEMLVKLKLQEGIAALVQINRHLIPQLFDFSNPWKIDLENFMNEHFKDELSVEEFAHYTGRSISSFKQDFFRIYNTTPSRWLVKRRLEEARDMLLNKNITSNEVYLMVGFKNLSHFSSAFKKQFGYSPSNLTH